MLFEIFFVIVLFVFEKIFSSQFSASQCIFKKNPNDIHILWNQWLRRSLKEA